MNLCPKLSFAILLCVCTLQSTSNELHRLYNDIFTDDKFLHRNLITLNLLPHRLHFYKVDLLSDKLKLQLSVKLWSPNKSDLTAYELSLYIQSLVASCVDPRDFYGLNLVDQLNMSIYRDNFTLVGFDRYMSLFTMCLVCESADEFTNYVGQFNVKDLLDGTYIINDASISNNNHQIAQLNHPSTVSNCATSKQMDEILMKTMAASCYSRLKPVNFNIERDVNDVLARITKTQNSDGSFGNHSLTTTALALQILIDSHMDKVPFFNRKKAMQFILQRVRLNETTAQDAYFLVPAYYRSWSKIGCRTRFTKHKKHKKRPSHM